MSDCSTEVHSLSLFFPVPLFLLLRGEYQPKRILFLNGPHLRAHNIRVGTALLHAFMCRHATLLLTERDEDIGSVCNGESMGGKTVSQK